MIAAEQTQIDVPNLKEIEHEEAIARLKERKEALQDRMDAVVDIVRFVQGRLPSGNFRREVFEGFVLMVEGLLGGDQ